MLYKKNYLSTLSDELFRSPTSEYRAAPFWAWNCKLEEDELLRQIEIFHEMGFGGFHMHVRTGMDTEYLSDEFMHLIRSCTDKAKSEKMLAWLYDEDRWPSGAAGGIVTKDKRFRARHLLFTVRPYDGSAGFTDDSTSRGVRSEDGELLACYDIVLDSDGYLKSYKRIGENDPAEGTKWYAYLEISGANPWYNGQAYLNTLDKKAVERFVEVTHERYKEVVGDEFDETVPAIFTDEPQFTRKTLMDNSTDTDDLIMPWTDDFAKTYSDTYSQDIMEFLPEIFWDLPDGKVSTARYRYHDHIAERFSSAFADTVGGWCRENGIALTGHMMDEPTLESQTGALGEAMRSYRSFGLPGIDMLCSWKEYTTAKQAQSAAHQFGYEGVLSELYGVTDWDFDFRGHKLNGDWQAALGVTVRVPHLSWVSMAGEAKRDYPASINYQSPWYEKYPLVEDHFARLNTALTRGTPDIRVGVIHPVESYWLHWGPASQTALERDTLDTNFQNLTEWLLFGSVDFDFIAESLLPAQCAEGSAPLTVGRMKYDVVIVPGCETLRATTCERLREFRRAGGRLIFMGSAPKYLDAVPSDEPRRLYDSAEHIGFTRGELLTALDSARTVDIRQSSGELTGNLVHQLRRDGDGMWLFIAQGKHPYNKDISRKQSIKITINGIWRPTVYDTLSGSTSKIGFRHENGRTVINAALWLHDSLLLKLDPCGSDESYSPAPAAKVAETPVSVPFCVPFALSEPNVLLLDRAEFAFDGGELEPAEELLRIDTLLRRRLGWDPWGGSSNQPWCIPAEPPTHTLKLRFTIDSRIPVTGAHLALEAAADTRITLNGVAVPSVTDGYYTDRSIKTVKLPDIPAGTSVLELEAPFGKRTATEWCYLLGDFGVRTAGAHTWIEKLPETLGFETITTQGLPFYSGCISYFFDITTTGGELKLRLPQYRAAVYECSIDGGKPTTGAFAPYEVRFGDLPAGKHRVEVELWISRTNGFGHLHCADRNLSYASPGAWRTSGDSWCPEYRLHEEGIVASPILSEIKPL